MSDVKDANWLDNDLRRRLLEGLGYKGEKAYRSLREAGYATADDLAEAHPREIKKLRDVGGKTLLILNQTVDGFDAYVPDQYRDDPGTATITTACPNCDDEIPRQKLGHHLRKCVAKE